MFPDTLQYLLDEAVSNGQMHIVKWCMSRNIYPTVWGMIDGGIPRNYLLFEYLLQNNIYPDRDVLIALMQYPNSLPLLYYQNMVFIRQMKL